MIKHRIMSVATLLGGVIFTGHVVAQSPEGRGGSMRNTMWCGLRSTDL